MTNEEQAEIFANICMDIEKQAKALAAESKLSYQKVMSMIIQALSIVLAIEIESVSSDD